MTLFLSDSEARSFAQGGRVLWRESNYIPKLSNGFHWEVDGTELLAVENAPIRFPNDGPEMQPTGIDVPFKPGNHVELRETWWFAEMIEKYIFKADARDDGNVFHHGMLLRPDRWHSPVGLPSDGVRWHMIVKSVEVEQRDEKWWWKITMEERCTTPPNG